MPLTWLPIGRSTLARRRDARVKIGRYFGCFFGQDGSWRCFDDVICRKGDCGCRNRVKGTGLVVCWLNFVFFDIILQISVNNVQFFFELYVKFNIQFHKTTPNFKMGGISGWETTLNAVGLFLQSLTRIVANLKKNCSPIDILLEASFS